MKRWRLPLVLGAVALTAIAATVAVAKASANSNHHRAASNSASPSACAKLTQDPTANAAMQQLHQEHAAGMKTWQDTYGADATSPRAKQALADLRKQHLADMRALFSKLGIKVPAGLCDGKMMSGSAAGMMSGGSDSMMGGGSDTGSSTHEQHHPGQTATPGATTGGGSDSMMGGGSDSMMGGSSL
jgi:hypothetical protein